VWAYGMPNYLKTPKNRLMPADNTGDKAEIHACEQEEFNQK